MQKAKQPNHAKQSGQHFLDQIRYNFSRMDWWILLIVGLLSVYSLIMVYSSTQYLLENGATVPTPLHYLSRQMFGIGLGLAVSAVAICLLCRQWPDCLLNLTDAFYRGLWWWGQKLAQLHGSQLPTR